MFLRMSVSAVLCVLCLSMVDAGPPDKPSPPTNTIFTYSPLFGDAYTVRAAWSPPKNWGDGGGVNAASRSYLATCHSIVDGVFYSVSVPEGQYLVQFQVPALNRKYTFTVYAINGLGKMSRGDSYSVQVP